MKIKIIKLGEPTYDGRVIDSVDLELPEPIPVVTPGGVPEIIGKATDLSVEDGWVMAEVDLKEGVDINGRVASVYVDNVVIGKQDVDLVVITTCRLRGIFILSRHQQVWDGQVVVIGSVSEVPDGE